MSGFNEMLDNFKKEYSYKIGGRVYTAPNDEKAIERCLELADFDVCLSDITKMKVRCNCDRDREGFVCVNPNTNFYFVVTICKCKK